MAGKTLTKAFALWLSLLAAAQWSPWAASVSAARKSARRGGGISLLLTVKAEGPEAGRAVERTAAVIEKRCARLGVRCVLQRRAGGVANQLALRFSTRMGVGRVKSVLLAEGMEVRAVVSPPFPDPLMEYPSRGEAEAAAGGDVLPYTDEGTGTFLVAERPPVVTGDDLRDCVVLASRERRGEYEVDCRLRPAGSARLKSWTRANINRYVVVVFNGQALSAWRVVAPIEYNVVVSGGFHRRQARDAAAILGGGNLPAPVEVLEEKTYNH